MILITCLIGGHKNIHSYLIDVNYNIIRHFKNTYINGGTEYTKTITKLLNNGIEMMLSDSLEKGIETVKMDKLFNEKKKLGLINLPSDEEIDTLIKRIISEETK